MVSTQKRKRGSTGHASGNVDVGQTPMKRRRKGDAPIWQEKQVAAMERIPIGEALPGEEPGSGLGGRRGNETESHMGGTKGSGRLGRL